MNTLKNEKELIDAFSLSGDFIKSERVGDGHINDTFVFVFNQNGNIFKYLVQQLNTFVFTEPVKLMENIVGVTNFIKEKIIAENGDPDRRCLTFYPAKDGKFYYVDSDNCFWRCCNFVEDSHTYLQVNSADDFYKAAKAFGHFQSQLSDYPIETLNETIVNFHNTVSRFNDFKKAVENNISGRKDNVKDEIDFFLARENDCSVIVDLIEKGEIPIRVTHNDTKLNNVMFDDETDEGICIVDLDTVMPGSSLYDFGDSIRFGCNTGAEDEKDLNKVNFSLEYFEIYVKGWIESAGKAFCDNEIKYLPFAGKLMTLECGMRFLADYLNGDVYFKTEYPEHNLVRAKTHIKLINEMEKYMSKMEEIVEKYR